MRNYLVGAGTKAPHPFRAYVSETSSVDNLVTGTEPGSECGWVAANSLLLMLADIKVQKPTNRSSASVRTSATDRLRCVCCFKERATKSLMTLWPQSKDF